MIVSEQAPNLSETGPWWPKSVRIWGSIFRGHFKFLEHCRQSESFPTLWRKEERVVVGSKRATFLLKHMLSVRKCIYLKVFGIKVFKFGKKMFRIFFSFFLCNFFVDRHNICSVSSFLKNVNCNNKKSWHTLQVRSSDVSWSQQRFTPQRSISRLSCHFFVAKLWDWGGDIREVKET